MGDSRCPVREKCKRFLQIGIDSKRFPDGMPLSVNYSFDLRSKDGSCDHRLEVNTQREEG